MSLGPGTQDFKLIRYPREIIADFVKETLALSTIERVGFLKVESKIDNNPQLKLPCFEQRFKKYYCRFVGYYSTQRQIQAEMDK